MKEGDMKVLSREELRGKFMRIGDYVLEWLPEWFRDSKVDY